MLTGCTILKASWIHRKVYREGWKSMYIEREGLGSDNCKGFHGFEVVSP